MRGKLFCNIPGKLVAVLIALVFIVSGVCYSGVESKVALAADSETTEVAANEEGYYVKAFTAANFNTYKEKGTYPKLTTTDGSDAQDWLFAGWYQTKNDDGTCATAYSETTTKISDENTSVYAKFVPAGVLTVKCQVTPDTSSISDKTNMRLISTTDDGDYSGIGFDVTYKGKTIRCSTNTLYKRISATDDKMESGYSPDAFHAASDYFFSVRLTNIGNANFKENFYIQPYWITADGTTVYGNNRYARIEDSYEEIVNLPVRLYSDDKVTSGKVSLEYDATKFELYAWDGETKVIVNNIAQTVFDTVTYKNDVSGDVGTITLEGNSEAAVAADGIFANIRLRLKQDQLIESNTAFAVTNNGFTNSDSSVTFNVSDVLYRNYALEYVGNSDKSWYVGFEEETKFVLSTAADLYGLAEIVNAGTDTFAGDEIILGADITVNAGEAYLSEDGTAGFTRKDGKTPYEWIPIGPDVTKKQKAGYRFSGTFNGKGNTISGIYLVDDDAGNDSGLYHGLFGVTNTPSVLMDFSLVNSTFISEDGCGNNGTSALLGSVAGQPMGDVKYVYSNAYVVSENGIEVGGIAGRLQPGGSTTDMDNCWFDGKIYAEFSTQKMASIGGVAGKVFNKGTVNITNCHNTGKITCIYNATGSNYAGIAGFVGRMENNTALKLNIENSMNNGPITVYTTTDGGTTKTDYTKGVAGYLYNENYGSAGTGVYKNSSGKEVTAGGTTNVTIKNCITTTSSCASSYQRINKDSEQDFDSDGENDTIYPMSVSTNCENGKADTDYSGYAGHETAARLGIYAYNDAKDLADKGESLCWVVTESGIPKLKHFCKEWIDVGWHYNDDYVIYTAEELYGFSVMSSVDDFSGDTIYLGADVKMNEGAASSWASGKITPDRTFTPIGKTKTFKGTFDGSYDREIHSISGLYINDESEKQGIGLFAQATVSVQNLKLKNSCIINNNTTTSTNNTGSVVGYLNGGTLQNVYSNAYVVSKSGGSSQATGGLVGLFGGAANTISRCWFDGEVTSNGKLTGGVVGLVYKYAKTIDNCLNSGTVTSTCTTVEKVDTGGIVGCLDAEEVDHYIKNSINLGKVSSEKTGVGLELGSVIGNVQDPLIFQNVYTTDSTGGTIAGIGETAEDETTDVAEDTTTNTTIDITGRPLVLDTDDLTGENAYIYTELDFTSEDPVWGAVEDGMIVLCNLYDGEVMTGIEQYQRHSTDWYCNNTTYDNTLTDAVPTYTVLDEADFYGMSKLVNSGMTSFSGKTVQLQKETEYNLNSDWTVTVEDGSVTTEGTANKWTPIGTKEQQFEGKFDGNENIIQGVYVNASTEVNGLFGYGASSSVLQNFTLENSYFNVTANEVGSVAGVTMGSLQNIYVKETVAVCNTAKYTGGLVGDWLGNTTKYISNCWFDGTVCSNSESIGGMVGRVYNGKKTLENCLFTGHVYNTYNKGYFSGGFIGIVNGSGTASPSVYLTNCVGTGSVDVKTGGAVGSVVGRSITGTNKTNEDRVDVHVENVYTTDDLTSTATLSTDYVINGFGNMSYQFGCIYGEPMILDKEDLAGEQGYINTNLDFEELWVATNEGPKLKSFATADVTDFTDVQKVDTSWYYNELKYVEDKQLEEGAATNTNAKATDQRCVSFEISDIADMYGFAALVNKTLCDEACESFSGKTVSLTADVTFNNATNGDEAAAWFAGGETPESWMPIGTTSNTFQGKFDGGEHTISGIYVGLSSEYIGLFGKITDATICNLRLENSYINSLVAAGKASTMGSIAGGGDGTFQNVYSNAYVHGSQVVGGLMGRVEHSSVEDTAFTMTSCWFDGVMDIDYTGSSQVRAGGLIGYSYYGKTSIDTCLYAGTIDCDITYTGTATAYGSRIGGIVSGDNDTAANASVQVKNSLSAGEIDTTLIPSGTGNTSPNPGYIGSVFGYVSGADTTTTNVYAVTKMTSKIADGDKETSTVRYSYNKNKVTNIGDVDNSFTNVQESLVGLGSQMWTDLAFKAEDREDSDVIWAAVKDSLPVPATLAEDALSVTVDKPDMDITDQGEGTETSPYEIDSIEEFAGFAILSQTDTFSGKYVKLTENIIINEGESAEQWAADKASPTLPWHITIGKASGGVRFAGSFDGNGKTISGISAELSATYFGLFNATDAGSAIKNIRLKNSYFRQRGEGYTGSIVGDCRSSLENVYSNAIIDSSNEQVGGIVGRANGWDATNSTRISSTMTDCWFDGIISMKEADDRKAGGIIGNLVQGQWALTNCLFTGEITCNYAGDGNAQVGGMCGIISAPESVANSSMASKLTLDSCISAGTIITTNGDQGAGAVVGRLMAEVFYDEETGEAEKAEAELSMTNVFATRTAGGLDVGSTEGYELTVGDTKYTANPTVTGEVVWTHNEDRLIGYCTELVADGEEKIALDFDSETPAWMIRDKGTPVPATFEDVVEKVNIADLDSAIGLDVWSASLKDAKHYGAGRYVLTFGDAENDSKSTYKAYISKLSSETNGLGFTLYAGNTNQMTTANLSGTGVDGVYNAIYTNTSGDWVLNVLYTENTGVTTITINTGVKETLSPNLIDNSVTTTGDITLGMLELKSYANNENYIDVESYYYGSSFVFQLPDGHFIINDGGSSDDYEGLIAYLTKLAGDDPIYIDAWTVSHQHADHFNVIRGFYENLNDTPEIYVEAFYINEPNEYTKNDMYAEEAVGAIVEMQYRGIRTFKTTEGDATPVYWYQTGQRYYFNGITMDVIQSQEQIPVSSYALRRAGVSDKDYNTASTVLLFTTDRDQKILISGDANYVNMNYIMSAYGKLPATLSGINVFAAWHHGKNTSDNIATVDNTFTDYLTSSGVNQFDVTLFPCSVFYDYNATHDIGAFPAAGGANKYLIETCTKTDSAYNYGAGNVIVTLGDTISVKK